MKNFALIGAAGYVAKRHVEAIKNIKADLTMICDPNDNVGYIDSYFPDSLYFKEIERFDRQLSRFEFNKEQIDFYKDCPMHCVKAAKGSVIMWNSKTVHCGIESFRGREKTNIRCVVYLCYLPRNKATEKDLEKKRKAFNNQRMCSHWANKAQLFPKNPRTYGGSLPNVTTFPKPVLTELGKKLAGF